MNFVLGHIQGHDRGQGLDRGRAIVNVLPAEADRGAEAGTTSDEIGRRRTRVDRRRAGTVPRRAEETAVPSGETDHVLPSKTTALSAGACLEGKVVATVESRVKVVMELPSERETLLARSLALTETRLQRRCRFLLKKMGILFLEPKALENVASSRALSSLRCSGLTPTFAAGGC